MCLLMVSVRSEAATNPWIDGYSDPRMEALLAGYYASDAAAEDFTKGYFKDALKNYGKTFIAQQSIMLQKYYEHKHGFRDIGILGSAEENYYYRSIYNTVSRGIIPETFRCAYLLAKNPSGIIYWGPFMFRICNETMDLCGQFETVVTNCKLGFENIAFPTLNKNLLRFADVKYIGKEYGMDLKGMISSIADFDFQDTRDSVAQFCLEKLKNIGVGIAAAGASEAVERATGLDIDFGELIGSEDVSRAFKLKPQEVRRALDATRRILNDRLYDPNRLRDYVKSIICENGKILVDRILSTAYYNAESYLSDYLHELDGQYYRQKVSVIIRDAGSEVVCDYNPQPGTTADRDSQKGVFANSVQGKKEIYSWSDDWTCYMTPFADDTKNDPQWRKTRKVDVGFIGGMARKEDMNHRDLTASELDDVRRNSEKHAGWSKEKCDNLNSHKSGESYLYEEQLHHHELHFDGKVHSHSRWRHQIRCYFAYSIKVTKTWSHDKTFWEKDFDSQTTDYKIFQNEIEQAKRSAEFEIASRGLTDATVVVVEGDRRYYQVPSNSNVKGASMVSFIVNCNDHSDLGHGTISWKEHGHINNTPAEQLVSYAMRTTPKDEGEDPVGELEAEAKSLQTEIQSLSTQIAALEKKNPWDNRIRDLEDKRQDKQAELNNVSAALDDARADAADDGDVHRLPWLEKEAAARYHLTWKENGKWEGTTYTRKGSVTGLQGTVTFTADFSVERRESYFLNKILGKWIRTHRGILKLDWKIFGDQSSSNVVETMALDTTKTDDENKQIVSDRQQQIMDMYPDCSVEVGYGKAESTDSINDKKSFHLLWASDRLALARDINARLIGIYSDLVLLHRFLNCKTTLLGYLETQVYVKASVALRDRIASDSFNAWLAASRQAADGLFNNSTGPKENHFWSSSPWDED